MKASHIYINPQGVPCAPIQERIGITGYNHPDPVVRFYLNGEAFEGAIKIVKDHCIPIREEDERYAFELLMATESYKRSPSFSNDTFYPVDAFAFEIENGFAKVIRP